MKKLLELEIKLIEIKEELYKMITSIKRTEQCIPLIDENNLNKSGYKGYTTADNIKRKSNNTSEESGIHSMNSIKQYGGSGVNALDRTVKELRRKSKKNPVKEFSPEEIAALNVKKSEELIFSENGQWSLSKAEGDNLNSHKNFLLTDNKKTKNIKTQWGTASHILEAKDAKRKSAKNPVKILDPKTKTVIDTVYASGKNKGLSTIKSHQ